MALPAFAWLAALALMVVWHGSGAVDPWRMTTAAVFMAAAAYGCWAGWKKQPAGDLAWDGGNWHWKSDRDRDSAPVDDLQVVADFQQLLILRVRTHAGARLWLWPERRSLPPRWLDLRRAVHDPRRQDAVAWTPDGIPAEESDEAVVAVSGQGKISFTEGSPSARP
jgi:toxin CptA